MRTRLVLVLSALAVTSSGCVLGDILDSKVEDRGSARLAALPAPVAVGDNPSGTVPLGLSDGARDGVIYVPSTYDPATAAPLLVLLHGAGGSGAGILATHEAAAEAAGVIVLAVDSRLGTTWDAITYRFDDDIDFIGEAIASVLGRYRVDRSRIGLAGFSDGASYAMMLGVANGDIFRKVIVHSPGTRFRVNPVGRAAFYVAHGTEDAILPYFNTADLFVPYLRDFLGAEVTFRTWDGGHAMRLQYVEESVDWLAGLVALD